jgi:tripartite-type tricarboxylate transporter receptor subunit TctC
MVFLDQQSLMPHLKTGKLRALAVTSANRNPLLPDIPTLAEVGIEGYEAMSWSGLSAIRGTPQTIIDRLDAAMRRAMASPDIRDRLESQGFVVPPPGGEHYTRYMSEQIALWTRVIKAAGIKPE